MDETGWLYRLIYMNEILNMVTGDYNDNKYNKIQSDR